MAASLGDLVVSIAGDIAKLEASMSNAERIAEQASRKIDNAMDVANKAIASVAAGYASWKSLEAFVDNVTNATAAAAELARTAQKTATSAEDLSKFAAIAKQSGTNIQAVAQGLTMMARSMYDTASGTGKARDSLAALGLSVRDSNGQIKNAADFLVEYAKKTSNMSNETQRLGNIQKVLKGSGIELSEFLRELADAGEVNAMVTNKQAEEALTYEKTLLLLDSAKKRLYNTISQQVTPVMTALLRVVLDLATGTEGLNSKVKALAATDTIRQWAINTGIVISMVIDGLRYVVMGFKSVYDAVNVVATWFVESFKNMGTAVASTMKGLEGFVDIMTGIGYMLTGQFQLGMQYARKGVAELAAGAGGMADRFNASFKAIGDSAKTFWANFTERAADFGSGSVTEKFLEQVGKMGEGLGKVAKAGTDTGGVIKKFQKDAIDALAVSLEKSTAGLKANLQNMQDYGASTKSVTVAETEATLKEMEHNGALAEHARRTGESVAATKERILTLAKEKDQVLENIKVEEARIAEIKKEQDATMSAVDQVTAARVQIETYGQLASAATRYQAVLEREKADTLALFEPESKLVAELRTHAETLDDLATKQAALEAIKNQVDAWSQLGDIIGKTAATATTSWGGAVKYLRDQFKQLFVDMLALFAKKWILNMAAGATGGTTGNALASTASNLGANTLLGGLNSWAGNLAGSSTGLTGIISGAGTGLGGAFGTGVLTAGGDFVGTGLAGLAGNAALAAGATDAFAASVASAVPVIGWIVAIGALLYTVFGSKGGGPKGGASFMAQFNEVGDMMGNVNAPGTQNGRFFTPSTGDSQLADVMKGQGAAYAELVRALGGNGRALQFGLGYDTDPSGSAGSRVEGMVADSAGNIIYHALQSVSNDNLGAEMGTEMKRELVAALQATDISPYIDKMFDEIGDVSKLTADQVDAVIQKAIEMAGVLSGLDQIGKGAYGLHMTIEDLSHFAVTGESIGQTFQRVGQAWVQLVDQFASPEEKLDAARSQLAGLYSTLANLGITAPKTRQDWLHVMQGIDLSTEAGRNLFNQMLALAPSFDAVTSASESMMSSFDQLMGKLRPGYTDQQNAAAQSSAVSQFMANNAWTAGQTQQSVIAALLTITRDDFGNYSSANQQLILQILGFASNVDSLSQTVSSVNQSLIDDYPKMLATGQSAAQKYFSDISSQFQGDFATKMPQIISTVSGEIANLQAQANAPGAMNDVANWTQLQSEIVQLTALKNSSQSDLNSYFQFDAQSPGHGEALLQLQKWFDDSKALVQDNTPGMLALEDEFQRRRAEIMAGGTSSSISSLQSSMQKLTAWWQGLSTDQQLSPLTLQDQLKQLRAQYETTLSLAQSGDTDAIGQLSDDAQKYLSLARQLDASNSDYIDIYRTVTSQTGAVAKIPQSDINAKLGLALPEDSKLASSNDVEALGQQMTTALMATSSDPATLSVLNQILDALNAIKRTNGIL